MNRQDSFSWVSKGFLAAAVVVLIAGAEQPDTQPLQPDTQPLSQTQREPVERILMYDAQPVGTAQAGKASQVLDYTPRHEEQRWVF